MLDNTYAVFYIDDDFYRRGKTLMPVYVEAAQKLEEMDKASGIIR
jgi:hypothetical protein